MKLMGTLVAAIMLLEVSRANAEEKTFVETAVNGTQISGYVNSSAHWDFTTPAEFNPGQIQAVPEPSSVVLFGAGCVFLGLFARKVHK